MAASNSNVAADKVELTTKLLSTFKPAKVFTEQVQKNTEITSLSFDDKGEFLVTAGLDETIQLFNCKTGKHVKTLFSKKYGVHLARFTHKSSSIIYASTKEDDTIRYHSLHDNKYLQYFRGHKNKVVTLQMSPKDDTFISGAVDDSIRLWDLRSPNCQGMMKIQGHPVVAYDLTGAVFALALNERGVISLYDAAKFEQRPFLTIILNDKEHLSKITMPPRIPIITSLEFSNSGNDLLVGTSGDVHYIVRSVELDKEDPNPVFLQRRLIGFEGLENVSGGGGRGTGMVPDAGLSGSECCWTPDGKFVISGSASGKIYIWEIPSQPLALGEDPNLRPCATIDGHTGVSRCVAFNPRTSVMASAGSQMALWLPEESES